MRKFILPAGMAALVLLAIPNSGHSHGTMLIPESRIHYCRYGGNPENHPDPACKAAISLAGVQPFYDWNGVRQGSANGKHREIIPDGQLCSGGNSTFRGLDLPRSDWRATSITPDSNGQFEFIYHATAPHVTKDMVFYITQDGWDPTQPLAWNDVDEFCRTGSVPLTTFNGKKVYRMNCKLPSRIGHHTIFHTWQRSVSEEAFYACSDVTFSGSLPPIPGNTLKPIGRLTTVGKLPVDTRISFRLLDKNSADVEKIEVLVEENQGAPEDWAYNLAQKVNDVSKLIRIGVLSGNGQVKPTRALNGNIVYSLSMRSFSFVIDKQIPAKPEPPEKPGTGKFDFEYPKGIGTYQSGTIVKGSDGNRYQCKSFPHSGWCNQAPFYYDPATGLARSDPWFQL